MMGSPFSHGTLSEMHMLRPLPKTKGTTLVVPFVMRFKTDEPLTSAGSLAQVPEQQEPALPQGPAPEEWWQAQTPERGW